jgi:serine/threonine protein phosphatase PrpC
LIYYAAATDKGVRANNEDRVLVADVVLDSDDIEGMAENRLLAVVCDGVGGEAFGAVAAELAINAILNMSQINTSEAVFEAVRGINEIILSAQRKNGRNRMACTIAGM